jgi:SAM-dependent methyltransferase
MIARTKKLTADPLEKLGVEAGPKLSGSARGLACPDCGEPIRESGDSADSVGCTGCQRQWPVVDGIPLFVQEFPHSGKVPNHQMRELNRITAATNSRTALLECDEPPVYRVSEIDLSLEQANWHWLLNLPAESRVLDIGAGMGTHSHALALRFREVIATESVLDHIQFMRQRFAQERLSNIKIVRTSVWDLPFAERSMDLIAMNGVFATVAEGVPGDPGELQREALRKVACMLRTGGYLYIGSENRYYPGYFLGHPDPYGGLPWVTVSPRPLAQWLARRKSPDGYRNYLYSSRGYRKLLQKTGFTDIKLYAAIPSYNLPRFLIPMKGREFQHYARSFEGSPKELVRRAVKAALLKTNLLQNFVYSFAILARK